MKKTLVSIFVVMVVVAFMIPALAQAEVDRQVCDDGKVPVTTVTPSGHSKVLCLPQAAVQAIENAQDHASSTFVTALCPKDCWTAETLAYHDSLGTITCLVTDSYISCGVVYDDGSGSVHLYGLPLAENICDGGEPGAPTPIEFVLSDAEHEACRALLEPYIVEIVK